VHPVTDPLIIALLGARLRPLRAEPAGTEQAADVIRMVDDVELTSNDLDDPSTGPQASVIAGRFRPRQHQARQALPLRGAELRGPTGRRTCAQPAATLSPVRPLPPTDGASIDAQAFGHDMNRDVTLEQVDRAKSPLLEFSRAPLWAHAAPPTEEYSDLGHYLSRDQ
jgi:hypothetical protein